MYNNTYMIIFFPLNLRMNKLILVGNLALSKMNTFYKKKKAL